MFLKRIEIQGFKSFADKTVLNFDHPITGIVGPNGSGKSNISDAVRWALGEQSVKALRGDASMTSIIFSGSTERRTVNMAEVTLVFDNMKRYLAVDYDEVEITRRIHRSNGDVEYFINKVPCRLKDILDITMDSGLSKDSLNVISQGNIASFADAKPLDRRSFFEEAAGVSKYKKKKTEAVSKLSRTQENLDRANDIIIELEKQVNPLKRAAKKAEIYREKRARLQAIETAVLIEEIGFYQEKMDEAKKALFEAETKSIMHETTIQVSETSINEKRVEVKQLDNEIQYMQEKLMHIINEIQVLETRKIEIDEKRKYMLEAGNSKQQQEELKSLLDEALFEYEDRKKRYESNLSDISLYEQQNNDLTIKIIDQDQAIEMINNKIRRLNNQKSVLENTIQQPFLQQAGVSSIMNAANSLPGVLGVIATIMKPQKGYEEAISVALGGALYNIVTKDEASARNAISYLKRNRSGRATFLPRNVLSARYVAREDEIIADNTKGFLGFADEFVDCDEVFDVVKDSLLKNVLVVDELANGNQLAALVHFRYKIVTLDGDVIHRGGSMTGGYTKNNASLLTAKKDLNVVEDELITLNEDLSKLKSEVQNYRHDKDNIDSLLLEKRINGAKLEPIVEAKRAKYERLKNDYQLLNPQYQNENSDKFDNELVTQLSEAYSQRDELTTNTRLKRETRLRLSNEVERKEQQIRQYRQQAKETNAELERIRIDIARLEILINKDLDRLASEYHMTYEYAKANMNDVTLVNAKDEVNLLRQQIESLGNVNMSAPEEFSELNERYDKLKKNYDELLKSREKLLAVIEEMDKVMVEQFKDMFDKINEQFQITFTQLFGGGKARLILEDPHDLLNTGIEIEANPPGKLIRNNRSLSGGEKTLIAFCVLFAILRTRPVPLCLFDEVDTALDPANNDRFANYLKQFSNESQFLVLTHRTATMAKCDVLYGVTMPKQGVSKLLKVQLNEAERLTKKDVN
ncbi:MAG: AAA family ATPase [Erysipelotrichaceae bacterium]|nr:AAA family ATPase [Erysipelotrichaceae bacterium]